MKQLIISVSTMILISFAQTNTCDSSAIKNNCSGIWAVSAKPPYVGSGLIPSEIPAPNGTSSVKASRYSLSLVSGEHTKELQELLFTPALTEVLWSPDSRNFVINTSEGGWVGQWNTYFYSIDQDGYPISRDLESLIRSIANNFAQCDPPEEANIGTVAWLNDGKELLFVAEVPPHSSCRNMGDTLGFRVSVQSWKVIERISEGELQKNWTTVFGCRFMENIEPDQGAKRAKPPQQ